MAHDLIIDFECDSPTEQVKRETIKLLDTGSGFAHRGYFQAFRTSWAAMLGLSPEEFDQRVRDEGRIAVAKQVLDLVTKDTMTDAGHIAMMDDAGIAVGCIGTTGMWASVEDRAATAAEYPDRLMPFYRSDPHEGMPDVFEFERTVRDLHFRGLVVSGFRDGLPSNHKKYYPFYAKCVELGVPARITTSLHLYTDRPIDLSRPAYLDEIACDFPELKIVAGLGGWPWVDELVAVARRHQNVHIDLSCVRPSHMERPELGYLPLVALGNKSLQDQIIFASGWTTQGLPVKTLIAEAEALVPKESVRQKWMHDNAARVLGLT